jgi:hypothetical protein
MGTDTDMSPKGKTYRDAQLRELVHSVVVEQLPEHELAYESEPAWERGEGEAVAEQEPPRASGCEAVTPSRGRRLGVVEVLLPEKHQAPLPSEPNDDDSGFTTLPPVPLQE